MSRRARKPRSESPNRRRNSADGIASKDDATEVVVAVGTGAGDSLPAILSDVVEQAGLWHLTGQVRRPKRGGPTIAIKIDLGPTGLPAKQRRSVATSARAVELLIDHFHDRGARKVIVLCGGNNALGRADEAGYAFVTPSGRPYDIFEVQEDLQDNVFNDDSMLSGVKISRFWAEATLRIVFAKSTTDGHDYYALCVHSLRDLVLDVREPPLDPVEVPTEILLSFPPDFALVDAWDSSHGPDGRNQPRSLPTRTLFACRSVLLCDWAAAFKMGLDPYASRMNARALAVLGLPKEYRATGELTPYADFDRPSPLYVEAHRWGGSDSEAIDRVEAWLQARLEGGEANHESNATTTAANGSRGPLLRDAAFRWTRVGLGYGTAAARRSLEAYRTLFAKEKLERRRVSVGLDPKCFAIADYEAVAPYLERLQAMVAQAEEDQAGLRWVYLDGSVVFQYQRVLAVPFRDFISRVDVGRSLEMMNDYLGGGSVVVARDDEENRVTHRMVRTVYLPQPNFQVLFGGCPIDVSKLQYTRYDKTVHKTYWRTVKSINGSATYDDGSVAFRGLDGNQMRITVVARQQFTLPLFWQAVQIDLQDAFKRAVLEYAYRQYFARTLANFEAAYERRDFRVGRDSLLERGRGDRLAEFARRWISRDSGLSDAAHSILAIEPRRPTFVDDDGWQYFDGPAPTSSKKRSTAGGEFEAWLADLSAAMRRDLGMASPTRNRRHRPGP